MPYGRLVIGVKYIIIIIIIIIILKSLHHLHPQFLGFFPTALYPKRRRNLSFLSYLCHRLLASESDALFGVSAI